MATSATDPTSGNRSLFAVADVEVIGTLGLVGVLPGHHHAVAALVAVAGVIAVGLNASAIRELAASAERREQASYSESCGRRTEAIATQ
jgi:hypothetical protein